MKEKWNEFKVTLTENARMTKKELILSLMVCLLGGIVFGMLFSPRKIWVIGSQNGNYCGNGGKCDGKKKEQQENEIADWEEIEKCELEKEENNK